MDTSDQLLLDKLLASISEYKATDMHLVAGNFPILRVGGNLVPLENEQPLNINFLKSVAFNWLDEKQKNLLERDRELVFSYTAANKMRFKVSVYYQKGTLAVSLKLIPQKIKNLEELDLPEPIKNILNLKEGLVIIGGPFASGKSTTISALVNYFNQNQTKHIIIIEDPIEYIFSDNKSIIEQREVGQDTLSFVSALKFVIEEDFDIVVLTEMEGAPVLKEVFKIVDSGRLVIASMHTESVIKTLETIVDSFPNSESRFVQEKLSEVLAAAVVQKVLPASQGGHVAAAEVFFPDKISRSLIKSGDIAKLNNTLYSPQSENIISFDKSLSELVKQGKINVNTALENANDKEYLQSLLN